MNNSVLPALFGGVFGLVVLALLLAIAIYWLLFPWFVYHKLDKIITSLDALNKSAAEGLGAIGRIEGFQAAAAAHSAPPLPGAERYFFALNGETAGPVPAANLRESFRRGKIAADTMILREGDKDWRPYSQVFR